MSWTSGPKHTTCRKPCVCSWCGYGIEVGEPKSSYIWRDGSDTGSENMHRECYQAMQETDPDDLHGVSFGDHSRGCNCQDGWCECVVGPPAPVEIAEVSK